ncbi:hypothetical protein [Methylotenera sp.]|uniref:hypothetical protein n=1 Tax=Methylotenera sp. TaxID=2051956 RepID=UPI002730231C|nr:hypothetical protein [Methylotenera sp.]MDP2070460.1 hypothetical protein [Methylotenera sp.]MDP3006274.1 hypothetical protein [Methylotenera sp.]
MIERETFITNDFYTFFQSHRQITHVFFNGAKAEAYFMRDVLPNINIDNINFLRLPSTSPANASMHYEVKLKAWRIILESNQLENEIISNQGCSIALSSAIA